MVELINILDSSEEELKNELTIRKEKGFRASQIFNYIYNGVFEFDEMKNIGESTRKLLKDEFTVTIPETVKIMTSKDGTRKGLFRFPDGNIVEAVLMKYEYGYSVCISTQVGCKMGCSFCASTKEGLVRNLTPGEMLSQILVLQKLAGERISNLVLMGSGEPFDNFDNVVKFLKLVNSDKGLNIGQRHITVSTCGIAPRIKDFADLDNQVTLAISLHETTDERRKKLMPVAYQYPLEELFEALKYYSDKTGRRISFEYALVSGVNDDNESALRLMRLLKGIKSHVNLIPLNEIKESILRKPDNKRVEEFRRALENFNIETTVRREMGTDIAAACGQLKRSFVSGETEK